MRVLITSFGLFIVLLFLVMINMSINSESLRQEEIENALKAAVDDTVKTVYIDELFATENYNEAITELCRNIVVAINSKGNVSIKILDIDYEAGMLDMLIEQDFVFPNGKKGTVDYRKTIIVE